MDTARSSISLITFKSSTLISSVMTVESSIEWAPPVRVYLPEGEPVEDTRVIPRGLKESLSTVSSKVRTNSSLVRFKVKAVRQGSVVSGMKSVARKVESKGMGITEFMFWSSRVVLSKAMKLSPVEVAIAVIRLSSF